MNHLPSPLSIIILFPSKIGPTGQPMNKRLVFLARAFA